MGCGDACPVLPGKRYVDWEPAGPGRCPLEEVRAVRDEIEHRVEELAVPRFTRARPHPMGGE